MKIGDSLYVLRLDERNRPGGDYMNLSLILDAEHGPTLVDTGLPGRLPAIEAALAEIGLKVQDLKRIILTHQDIDHIGSLAEIVRASGAKVLAHEAEAPHIDGRKKWVKMPPPEALEQMSPEMRAFLERGAEPAQVNQLLHDGEVLDTAGGVRVIYTPGHTPGHISLYLERDQILITGDALTAKDGQVQLPMQRATPDWPEAMRSVAKMAALEVKTLIAYHGGVVSNDVQSQLQGLVETK